ncbi:MAG: hypothetical protein JWN50_246 [Parcubacteria group bacterium]|nr:hypothetical protein [Parcubacteria group bacterium]
MEWGLLIGAAAFLDLLQIILDLTGIGLVVNPPIDAGVGAVLPIYFKKRGVKTSGWKWFAWISAPVLEFFTESLFPLGWVLEILMTMILDKVEHSRAATAAGQPALDSIESTADARRAQVANRNQKRS